MAESFSYDSSPFLSPPIPPFVCCMYRQFLSAAILSGHPMPMTVWKSFSSCKEQAAL